MIAVRGRRDPRCMIAVRGADAQCRCTPAPATAIMTDPG